MGCRCRLPASFSSFHRASLIVSIILHSREGRDCATFKSRIQASRPGIQHTKSGLHKSNNAPCSPSSAFKSPLRFLSYHGILYRTLSSPPPLLPPCIPNFRCQISPPQMLPLMLSSYPRERADECRSSNLSKPQNVRQLSRRLTFVMTFMSRNAFL